MSSRKDVGIAAAIREVQEAINCIDTRGLKRLLCELVESDIFDGGLINRTISAVEKARRVLSAPTMVQEFLESPMDLNEHPIHIGDTVHMLNTGHDGDHEWDDVVLSLEHVSLSRGDDWIVHGESGAALACECEVLKQEGETDGR